MKLIEKFRQILGRFSRRRPRTAPDPGQSGGLEPRDTRGHKRAADGRIVRMKLCSACRIPIRENALWCYKCRSTRLFESHIMPLWWQLPYAVPLEIMGRISRKRRQKRPRARRSKPCPGCGRPLNFGGDCLFCGTRRTFLGFRKARQGSAPADPNAELCPICFAAIAENARRCRACGWHSSMDRPIADKKSKAPRLVQVEDIAEGMTFCPTCHGPIEPGEKVCFFCAVKAGDLIDEVDVADEEEEALARQLAEEESVVRLPAFFPVAAPDESRVSPEEAEADYEPAEEPASASRPKPKRKSNLPCCPECGSPTPAWKTHCLYCGARMPKAGTPWNVLARAVSRRLRPVLADLRKRYRLYKDAKARAYRHDRARRRAERIRLQSAPKPGRAIPDDLDDTDDE